MIRRITQHDAQQICDIYNYYIKHTIVTFEEEEIDANIMKERILSNTIKYPWLVYEIDGVILGYAYAVQWKPRSGYRHSVESTVYLRDGHSGNGIGSKLYAELLDLLKQQNVHVVMGGIGIPNEGSIALHEKFGFRKVGHYKEIGLKFGKWIDVAYWQLVF